MTNRPCAATPPSTGPRPTSGWPRSNAPPATTATPGTSSSPSSTTCATALGGWLTRRFHWLWGALARYGYRVRRTALALLVALAVAGLVSLWAGHVTTAPGRHSAEHTATSGAPHTACSTVELIGLGLDRGLPLGPTDLRTRCDLDTATIAGQVFTVLLWVVQAVVGDWPHSPSPATSA